VSDPVHEKPAMLPRVVQSSTTLVREGRTSCIIVYPAQDHGYLELARSLAEAMARRTGVSPTLMADTAILPQRGLPLPDAYRRRPLLLLGNINVNRLLLPLYARYYCATDVTYPGGEGYDLRTLVNPYGTGVNFILAGGSTVRGAQRATERLIARMEEAGQPGELVLPFLLEVEADPALARQLAEWPDANLDRPLPTADAELLAAIGSYAIMYAWTGDRRYGEFARDCLRALNSHYQESYGDWHYLIERVVRAMPWLTAGGFLDEADILRTDNLILWTTYETQDMWWRHRNGRMPLGHRHIGKGTFMFYQQARYLRDQANPNAAARALCDRWIAECQDYLDALARARADDQDDQSSINNLATVFWYALGEERYEFFESGNARACAERAVGVHDNKGAGAGIEGYGEALASAMYLHEEAGIMVGACAIYYQDGEFKWVWENLPFLRNPLRQVVWALSPLFMHKYDPGPEIPAVPPKRFTGLRLLPLSPYQIELTTNPPEYLPPQGYASYGEQPWQLHPGVGRNTLPAARTFDKLVLRKSFAQQDPYLLLQGYTEPYRWQGSLHALNAIVRFSQGGHIFLIQNTFKQSYYHKNGLLVSDGYNDTLLPPLAEWLAAADFSQVALSATRVNDVHHTDWTRYLFWFKEGDGFFVVLDAVEIKADGPYSVTCTWRTPGYAELHDRAWQARQGDHLFTLRCSQPLPMTCEEQELDGASAPYELHQVQAGEHKRGDLVTFQNLFYVRPDSAPEPLDLRCLTAREALVVRENEPWAWCAVDPKGEGTTGPVLAAKAQSLMVTPEGVWAAGATYLSFAGGIGWRLESDRPVGVSFDGAARQLTVQPDGPDSRGATVRLWLGGEPHVGELQGPLFFPLPEAGCAQLKTSLRAGLALLAARPARTLYTPPPAFAAEAQGGLEEAWASSPWRRLIQERLREVTVATEPLPADGFPEQLVDSVLPDAWRHLARQWPKADQYDIWLRLSRETVLNHLRIIGDSFLQPNLRTFHPLPKGITVEVSNDHFRQDVRPCRGEQKTGVLSYERWHGFEDRLETLMVPIGAKAKEVHIRIPAPPSGEPLVCLETELYTDRWLVPPVAKMIPVDLDGDGQTELVAVSKAHEVVVLSADGTERWRWQAPNLIQHISCHDLDGNGRRQVCLGLLGTVLMILEPDGTLRRATDYSYFHEENKNLPFGFFRSIHALGVWHREPDGRAALMAGTYALNIFLDPDGRILGHAWGGGGAWQTDILACPPQGTEPWDMWVRNRWNHGISVYAGLPGMAPSGDAISFGGVLQPMFRSLRRTIRFVSGHTVAFTWVGPGRTKEDGHILAAAQSGVGVLSPTKEDWLWVVEGGTFIQACLAADVDGDGEAEVVVGGADGFVAAFGLTDGKPKGRLLVGAPVTGLAAWPARGLWFVGARERLLVLGRGWEIVGARAIPVRQLCTLDETRVVVAGPEGELSCLAWV
jgi:hypothetical protein